MLNYIYSNLLGSVNKIPKLTSISKYRYSLDIIRINMLNNINSLNYIIYRLRCMTKVSYEHHRSLSIIRIDVLNIGIV